MQELVRRRDWENPDITQYKRLDAHVPLSGFTSRADALQCDHTGSRVSLNGLWRFRLLDRPESLDTAWLMPDFSDEDWQTISVPSNWECQGFGQPRYTNKQYPFPCKPPYVPNENPVGCYRLLFKSETSSQKKTRVCFDGFASALYLWCNGTFIGYAQDGRVGAEFDLSSVMMQGQNCLCVAVLRWCDGSYLECQDMWSLSGLFRDVYLLIKPKISIEDFSVHQEFSEHYQRVDVRVQTRLNALPETCLLVASQLLSWDGEPVTESVKAQVQDTQTSLKLQVNNPKLWTDETPHLYLLLVWLENTQGDILDVEKIELGLREITLKNGLICLNGVPILFRGVNRHEFHPNTGYVVTEHDMLTDIKLLKEGNFNAVRTAHYPNCPRWYTLCNRFGLLLIDEANLETHGMQPMEALLDDPRWLHACLERVQRMVERDKNYTCIVLWSLGNEAGYGQNHEVLYNWVKTTDPSRFVHYEGGGADTPVTDIVCPMYNRVDEDTEDETGMKWALSKWLARDTETRPFILCEYSHAMGNSLGGIDRYWQAFRQYERLQGGFIWDWQDQGLAHPDFPQDAWAYGGDFGDAPHDQQFCINGLLFPDKTPHPAYFEAQHHQQYIHGTWHNVKSWVVCIEHEYQFRAYRVRVQWFYLENFQCKAQGEHLCILEPEKPVFIDVSACLHDPKPNHDYHLTCKVILDEEINLLEKGHCLARWQLHFSDPAPTDFTLPTREDSAAWLRDNFTFKYRDWSVDFCEKTGRLFGLRKGDKTLVSTPLVEQFFRAPTDNDYGLCERGKPHPEAWLKCWQDAGFDQIDMQKNVFFVTQEACDWCLLSAYAWRVQKKVIARTHWHYRFLPAGILEVDIEFFLEIELPPVARLGITTQITPIADVTWQGRGPHENYPDRHHSALFGEYCLPIEHMHTPYIFPSENGLRTGVRALFLGDLKVTSDMPFCFSLQPYSLAQLARVTHAHQLQPEPYLTLCLDAKHAGLGGDDSWSPSIARDWQIHDKYFKWTLRFELMPPDTH